MIEVKLISAEESYKIRKEILRKNITLTEKIKGDFDEKTFHLGAFYMNNLLGVATFMKNENSNFEGVQYRLRGMAVLENYQGKGIGKKLITKAITLLKNRKVDVLWCNARIIAINFYKKIGFKVKGSVFDIPLIGSHYVMYKKI